AGYAAAGGLDPCAYQVSGDLVWGGDSARARAMAVLDTMTVGTLMSCVQAPLATGAPALERMAALYQAGLDTSSAERDAVVLLWRLLQVRVPRGQVAAARSVLARPQRIPALSVSAA